MICCLHNCLTHSTNAINNSRFPQAKRHLLPACALIQIAALPVCHLARACLVRSACCLAVSTAVSFSAQQCHPMSHQSLHHAADFKQALGQQSSKGPAPPSKLTAHQTQIVKALIEAHADDVEVTLTLLSFTTCAASKQVSQAKLQRFSTPSHVPAALHSMILH